MSNSCGCNKPTYANNLCASHWRKDYRKRTCNSATKKYEKTKKGFLVRTYRNMKSRVSGIQKQKSHLYLGKSLLQKEAFYAWALLDLNFNTLFDVWEANNYSRLLTPSIDRIDSNKGYDIDNIRWLTHSENSRLGASSRYAKS